MADGSPAAEAAAESFVAALSAVDPTVLVRKAVRQGWLDDWFESRERPKPIHVLALGKAAPRMLWGLVEASVPFAGLGVSPRGVLAPNVDTFTWLPGDHPVPGTQSFAAGRRVLEWAKAFPEGEPLLVLLSGGASACAEVPQGLGEHALAEQWTQWLRSAMPIEEMNRLRAGHSALKGGKLGRTLLNRTKRIRVWMLADTDPATAPATVGSAPFFQPDAPQAIPHRVLAANGDAVAAAGLRLASLGYQVFRHGRRIAGPAGAEVEAFLAAAASLPAGQPTALVGGGEATVALPPAAPAGGRNQHAALLAAQWLHGHHSEMAFMAAASDGVDGTTDAAGAVVTAKDWDARGPPALAAFDAHRHLDARGRLLHMGPTGTNVNDLWVALRP